MAAAVVQTPGLIVPQLIGLTRAEASSALGQSGLRMESTGSTLDDAVVMSQAPAAATNAARGDIVRVVLSAPGRVPVAVPGVANDTRVAATSALTAAGFVAEVVGDRGDAARVVAQQPAAGTPHPNGSRVMITMKTPSSGGWLAPLAGLAAAAVALLAWLVFRRRNPPMPTPEPKSQPVAPVAYTVVVDAGRPTVRFAHEPPFAARALPLPRATEGTKS